MIDLSKDQIALVLNAVRQVPEDQRDVVFTAIARRLRHLRDIRNSDVNHAIGAALVGRRVAA